MIINLNENVDIEELSELTLSGGGIDKTCRVEVTFSKEALIGFATNLIWLYEDIDDKRSVHFHIDPLANPGANQAMGFFLTPDSPSLVIQVGGIKKSFVKTKNFGKLRQIEKQHIISRKFDVKEPSPDDLSLEEYEIGLRNIADIKIMNDDNIDFTGSCVQTVLRIGYNTLKKLATMLLVLADNYSDNYSYKLANVRQKQLEYNMGILFTETSPDVVIKCKNLGYIYQYDRNFGV